MGMTNPFDARQSILGGAPHFQLLSRRFYRQVQGMGAAFSADGRLKVVAAYHAGPRAVEKHRGIPPYGRKRKYVAAVMRRYAKLGGRSALASKNARGRSALGHRRKHGAKIGSTVVLTALAFRSDCNTPLTARER